MPLAWRGLLFLASALLVLPNARAEEPASPRRTEMVRLVERCSPAVVSVRTFAPGNKPGEMLTHHGSGALIHPAGYILTNAHVCRDFTRGEVQFPDDHVLPYRIVCKFVQEDLALLKIEGQQPFPTLPLGRSHDLMLGEPTLVIGNAGELSHSVSAGMISGLRRSTKTEIAFLPDVVQTSAAINGGNSGGPLINALGELIGVVVSKKTDADNIGFAIAVDRVRAILPGLISAEVRYGFRLGLAVDMLAPRATITSVALDGPAQAAGFATGDIIRLVGDMPVRQGSDFHLALVERNPGDRLEVQVERGGKVVNVACPLAPLAPLSPVVAEGKVPGLAFAAYTGNWLELPDFASQKPVAQGVTPKISAQAFASGKEHFALVFQGYVKVATEGLYTFSVRAHDGSRIYVGDRLVGDARGYRPAPEAAGLVRLLPGLHRLRVETLQVNGPVELTAYCEGPNLPRQEIPAALFFTDAPAPSK